MTPDQIAELERHGIKTLDELLADWRRMREALAWYEERARTLASGDWRDKPHVAEAIFTELSLDGGRRARARTRRRRT